MKSVSPPNCFMTFSISFPVKPAIKPSALLGIRKLLSTIETLIPLPPG